MKKHCRSCGDELEKFEVGYCLKCGDMRNEALEVASELREFD